MTPQRQKIHNLGKWAHRLFWPSVITFFLSGWTAFILQYVKTSIENESGNSTIVFVFVCIFWSICIISILGVVAGMVLRRQLFKEKSKDPDMSETADNWNIF